MHCTIITVQKKRGNLTIIVIIMKLQFSFLILLSLSRFLFERDYTKLMEWHKKIRAVLLNGRKTKARQEMSSKYETWNEVVSERPKNNKLPLILFTNDKTAQDILYYNLLLSRIPFLMEEKEVMLKWVKTTWTHLFRSWFSSLVAKSWARVLSVLLCTWILMNATRDVLCNQKIYRSLWHTDKIQQQQKNLSQYKRKRSKIPEKNVPDDNIYSHPDCMASPNII